VISSCLRSVNGIYNVILDFVPKLNTNSTRCTRSILPPPEVCIGYLHVLIILVMSPPPHIGYSHVVVTSPEEYTTFL